jgi:hypothetical protein
LNLCTLYSQLADHRKAIKSGISAINLLKKLTKFSEKLKNSLIIAYFNLANEYKAVNQLERCENLLRTGLNLSRDFLGASHELTETLSRGLKSILNPFPQTFPKNTQKIIRKSVDQESRTRFPDISRYKQRSSSDDNDYYKSLFVSQMKGKSRNENNFTFYKEHKKRKPSKPLSEEEESTRTDRSYTGYAWYKKFDIAKHKQTEREAAVVIQSWWRGLRDRRLFAQMKVQFELKQAEIKAKHAIEEYEKAKLKANRFKKLQGKK